MSVIGGMALIGIEKHSKSYTNYFSIISLMHLIGNSNEMLAVNQLFSIQNKEKFKCTDNNLI